MSDVIDIVHMCQCKAYGACDLCAKLSPLTPISKQIGGTFHRKMVCKDCYEKHQKLLEMTRQNFQRQFGDG